MAWWKVVLGALRQLLDGLHAGGVIPSHGNTIPTDKHEDLEPPK